MHADADSGAAGSAVLAAVADLAATASADSPAVTTAASGATGIEASAASAVQTATADRTLDRAMARPIPVGAIAAMAAATITRGPTPAADRSTPPAIAA